MWWSLSPWSSVKPCQFSILFVFCIQISFELCKAMYNVLIHFNLSHSLSFCNNSKNSRSLEAVKASGRRYSNASLFSELNHWVQILSQSNTSTNGRLGVYYWYGRSPMLSLWRARTSYIIMPHTDDTWTKSWGQGGIQTIHQTEERAR